MQQPTGGGTPNNTKTRTTVAAPTTRVFRIMDESGELVEGSAARASPAAPVAALPLRLWLCDVLRMPIGRRWRKSHAVR